MDGLIEEEVQIPLPPRETSNIYLIAKSYFDDGEYLRAANILRNTRASQSKSFFLLAYSLYLVSLQT